MAIEPMGTAGAMGVDTTEDTDLDAAGTTESDWSESDLEKYDADGDGDITGEEFDTMFGDSLIDVDLGDCFKSEFDDDFEQ